MKKQLLTLALSTLLLSGCGGSSSGNVVDGNIVASIPAPTPSPSPTTVPKPPTPPAPVIPDPEKVIFFRADAAAGGDGSSARPYSDLSVALANTAAGKTLFCYAGNGTPANFTGQVPDGVILQGEGVGLVTTGEFSVPVGNTPRVVGQVTLGQGVTVRGLQLENPSGNATVAGPNSILRDNRFTNVGGKAVLIDNLAGQIIVLNNVFEDTNSSDPTDGVDLRLGASKTLELLFQGNRFTTPDRTAAHDTGLKASVSGGSKLTLFAIENDFDVQGQGVLLQVSQNSELTGRVSDNVVSGALLEGVSVLSGLSSSDTATTNLALEDNAISGALGAGLSLRSQGASQNTWTVHANLVTNPGNYGLLLVRNNTSVVRATVTDNRVDGARQAGLQVTSGTASGGFEVPLQGEDRLTISGNNLLNSGSLGIALGLVSQTHAVALINNTSTQPVQVTSRGTNAGLAVGGNSVTGALAVAVERGFTLTIEDRGQSIPALTFPGGGTVRSGTVTP